MSGLEKPRKRKTKHKDYTMNDEWIEMHETQDSPLFWVDLSADSQLAVVQEKLQKIERKAHEILEKPRSLLSQLRRTLQRNH